MVSPLSLLLVGKARPSLLKALLSGVGGLGYQTADSGLYAVKVVQAHTVQGLHDGHTIVGNRLLANDKLAWL